MTYHLNDVEPDERGKYCEVSLGDSSAFGGELLEAGNQSFLIYSMSQKSYEDKVRFPFKEIIPTEQMAKLNVNILNQNEIDIVQFKEKSRFWSIIYPIIGGIAGAIIGYNLASANSNDNSASSSSLGGSTQINFNFGPSEQDKKNFAGILGGMAVGMIASIPLVIFLPIETTSETVFESPFNEEDLEGLRDKSRYKDEEPYYLQIIK
jgi:hypothetical protein